jgi:uncharacterized protein (DUF2236 family)
MTVAQPKGQVQRPGARRRRAWPRGASLDDGFIGMGLLAGPANVIMELARPGVGYGVMESRVESGRVDRHPIKRARTTFTYVAVALEGTDDQKAAFRRAVNGAHAQVYSTDDSPVEYNAFDPELQLWVAACIYKGVEDVYRLFIGEMDEGTVEQLYRDSAALGTTLQVPPDMWPPNRAAFEEYWRKSLEHIHIDDAVRAYLYPIAASSLAVPRPLRRVLQPVSLFITTGFLPQRFRDEMRLPWDERRQRRFDRMISVLKLLNNLAPRIVRRFPFNFVLADLNWRIKTGRPLV